MGYRECKRTPFRQLIDFASDGVGCREYKRWYMGYREYKRWYMGYREYKRTPFMGYREYKRTPFHQLIDFAID